MAKRLKAVWITVDRAISSRLEALIATEGWESLGLRSVPEALAIHSMSPVDLLVIDAELSEMAEPGAMQKMVDKLDGVPMIILRGAGGRTLEIMCKGPICPAPRDDSLWKTVSEPMFHLFMENIQNAIELESARRKLLLLQTVTKTAEVASSAKRTLDENLGEALKITLEAMNASRGSIMLLNDDGALVVRAATNPDIIGMTQSLDSGSIASISIRQNNVVRGENRDFTGVEPSEGIRGYKSPHLLTIPISFQGSVIGVINITDKLDKAKFSEDDESMFSVISGVIITALLSAEVHNERDRLKNANLKLRDLQAFKDTMINMLVHDLKGPAGDIMSNLSVLREYVSGDFAMELLDVAESSSEELLEMIMSILDLNKMEEGRFVIQKVETNIVTLARKAALKTQASASRANKTVKFEPETETLTAMVDERIISRVIWNLLSNANNHTGDGGEIKVCVSRLGENGFSVTVADNGAGIQKEYLDKVFEKFYQADDMRPVKYSTGLGLTFCKMAMEAHGGSISVQSEPGVGTSFSIIVPTAAVEKTPGAV
ncbi:MAG: GAF domain-containing sensor histidine kinase [Nitrospinae bacterium]|nr:GAF domain-containing sensor histidine kinase [Nitrospinota bacterium]